MDNLIQITGLQKSFGNKVVLDGINLTIPSGRIVGLIGPNGSGKTTTLRAILGLTHYKGEIQVAGKNPATERDELMQDVCFIADVAILPRWLKVKDAIDFVAGVHPKFNREKAESYIAKTTLSPDMKVKQMSKGMVVQLHLALIMAIDAKLLVLDEPTLGLDVVYRKMFYQNLLEDYFDEDKSIIITTHQVEEVEHILSDLIFIRDGKIVLQASMDQMAQRFVEVIVEPEKIEQAKAYLPIEQRQMFGRTIMMFDNVHEDLLKNLGETRTPSIGDLFVASMKGAYL